jgi:hypothetical protein
VNARKTLTAAVAVVVAAAAVAAWVAAGKSRRDGDNGHPAAPLLDSRVTRTADLETGDFTQFSESEALRGSLTVTRAGSYDGTHAATARYAGGPGIGYARATQQVALREGQDVWYGAAYYLPTGFKEAMQGEVAMLRWDNYDRYGLDGDVGGVVIWGSDRRARLVYSRYGRVERVVVGPFDVPEGQWFSLLVHQRLSRRPGRARNDVYLDALITGSSTAANTSGRPIDRMRTGLVAVDANTQLNPLSLRFDRCLLTVRRRPAPDRGASEREWAIAPQIEDR